MQSSRYRADVVASQTAGEDSVYSSPLPSSSPLIQYIMSYSWPLATSLLSEESNHFLTSVRSPMGELPLHLALRRSAPEDLILKLIELNPKAVRLTGENDISLPLHLATVYCATPRVIITILRKYPEALDIHDEDGDTPRHLISKRLDETARDALSKPTLYWTTLMGEIRREILAGMAKTQVEEVAAMEKKLDEKDRKLKEARATEKNLLDRVRELEAQCKILKTQCSEDRTHMCLKSTPEELGPHTVEVDLMEN